MASALEWIDIPRSANAAVDRAEESMEAKADDQERITLRSARPDWVGGELRVELSTVDAMTSLTLA